jgi:dTDP-4-dehydrorhamnose reductase
MKLLIFGATGMLGQALMKEAKRREFDVVGVARDRADINLDLLDDRAVGEAIEAIAPDIIINTVAIVNLLACENDPGLAYRTNARAVGILAEYSHQKEIYCVQISTDHYFTGDGNIPHNENSPVYLVNEYARTKYLGECLALTYQNTLIIRTNIIGFRGHKNKPTFMEWVLETIATDSPMVMFADFFTSSLDVTHFAIALFDLLEKQPRGLLNLASREVFSKQSLIEALTADLGISLSRAKVGSVRELSDRIRRAESLGLDTTRVEKILGYRLPTMSEVVTEIVKEYKERINNAV